MELTILAPDKSRFMDLKLAQAKLTCRQIVEMFDKTVNNPQLLANNAAKLLRYDQFIYIIEQIRQVSK